VNIGEALCCGRATIHCGEQVLVDDVLFHIGGAASRASCKYVFKLRSAGTGSFLIKVKSFGAVILVIWLFASRSFLSWQLLIEAVREKERYKLPFMVRC